MPSLNPYRAGNPVGDTDAFIGRTEILKTVEDIVADLHRNALALHGQRRIGKTSVLQQLEVHLSQVYCPIFWDWQDKADWSLRKVLEELTQNISSSLVQAKPSLGPDPLTTFMQWLADRLNSQNKPLVFLFDEFDVIATSKAATDIISYLGQLLNLNHQRLNCIFAIGSPTKSLTQDTVELFRIRDVESRFISLLTPDETKELICLSENNKTLQWSEPTIERVWQLTAGHPYFTQQLCSKVWDLLYQDNPPQSPTVTLDQVNTVIPNVLEASENILESLWRSFSPNERVVAVMLAQAPVTDWLALTKPLEQIAPELKDARNSLEEWNLIQKDNRGNYGFHVEIIRRWVKDHKSLYDELESREPYVAKIYEIAKQLKEKHPDIAQALLEPLGRLNPYHTKANQLLAEMLIKKKQLEKANGVLNKLYSYNANAAKEHLIKVLLELARSLGSNKESKEPSSWFEQVVYWWKSTFSPDIGEEEQRLNLYKQVLEIERNNIEAAREKRKIEEQRKAREWKQQVIKWKQSVKMSFKSKLTWRFLGIVLIFIVSYLFFSQRLFPPGIVLEVEQLPDKSTYLLENVPSDGPHHLQSITIYLDGIVNESPKFKYKNFTKEIDLIKGDSAQLSYGMNKDKLQQELKNVTSFEYEKENSIRFTFKAKDLKFKEECQASDINGKDIPCQVKEKGYLSVFRGIPWWVMAIFGVTIWILVVVEAVSALTTKSEDDDVVY